MIYLPCYNYVRLYCTNRSEIHHFKKLKAYYFFCKALCEMVYKFSWLCCLTWGGFYFHICQYFNAFMLSSQPHLSLYFQCLQLHYY